MGVYTDNGRDRKGDEELRKLLPRDLRGLVAPPPLSNDRPRHSHERYAQVPATGSKVTLPIRELRFAHDSQSEHYGRGDNRGQDNNKHETILQLAVELVLGLTRPEEVPTFNVCFHDGFLYCRSGNRRLAAFHLAHRFAPERFEVLSVQVVQVDNGFL